MKSKKQVLQENPTYKTLINAVVRNLGVTQSIQNVVTSGADAGFNGFIYYYETHAFAMRYRKLIVRLLEQQAEEMGVDVIQMVSGFGVFRNAPMDSADKKELYKYLGGGRNDQSNITNVMAWFALEEICRMFED